MRPLIGITCTFNQAEDRACLARRYIQAVEAAGGVPVLVGPAGAGTLGELAGHLAGLLLSGGGDLDPVFFGEEPRPGLGEISPLQDALELTVTARMKDLGRPVLGICRGAQVINVALGGSLYQSIAGQVPGAWKHFQDAPRSYRTHGVTVAEGSLLAAVMGSGVLRVNSFHRQAVARPAPGLKITARASDGVVEGIEDEKGQFLGVQWHPEWLWEEEPRFRALFEWLVRQSREV